MKRYGQKRELLFSGTSWFEHQSTLSSRLSREILDLDEDRIISADPEKLVHYFYERYSIDMISISREDISFDIMDADIEVDHMQNIAMYGASGPTIVRGVRCEIHIPYSGDGTLLRIRPANFSTNPPMLQISGQTLIHIIEDRALSEPQIESSVDGLVATIQRYLDWLGASVYPWNSQVELSARKQIDARREKLIAQRTVAANLKYKMRPRPGAATTYVSPQARRRVTPVMPPAGDKPWAPEPVLDNETYDHILSVITSAAISWERSPSAFSNMGEEALRTLFLVNLNGHYESATGETFNKDGKTDILIRDKGQNIFIGECKFWDGPKVLMETIDQILGYTSWRDTKVAIILFNRNKNFSAVLDQIEPTVTAHPNCKAFIRRVTESQFRFTFRNRDDEAKELTLSVLAFDVPQPT